MAKKTDGWSPFANGLIDSGDIDIYGNAKHPVSSQIYNGVTNPPANQVAGQRHTNPLPASASKNTGPSAGLGKGTVVVLNPNTKAVIDKKTGKTTTASTPSITTPSINKQPYNYKPSAAQAMYTGYMNDILKMAMSQINTPLTPTLGSGLDKYMINPKGYATSGANAQYDSSIDALKSGLARIMPQSKQNQADITDWYSQLAATNKQGQQASKAYNEQAQSQLTDQAQGIMGALGGEANPGNAGIGAAAEMAGGGLAAVGAADNNLATNLAATIGLSKNSALTNQQRDASVATKDLVEKIASQKKEKGQTYANLLSQANTERYSQGLQKATGLFDQRSTADNAKWQKILGAGNVAMGAGLAQGQITAQDLANVGSRYNIGQQEQNLDAGPTKLQIAVDQSKASIKQTLANIKRATGKVEFDSMDLNQTGKIQSAMLANIVNANGALKYTPQNAWDVLVASIQGNPALSKPKDQAAILAMAKSALKVALQGSHQRGSFRNFRFNSKGQLVKSAGTAGKAANSTTKASTKKADTSPTAAKPNKDMSFDELVAWKEAHPNAK